MKITKARIKEILSNNAIGFPILSSLANHTLVSGVPVPAKYPPSYLLIPGTKRVKSQLSTPLKATSQKLIQAKRGIRQDRNTIRIPTASIITGEAYYNKLKKSRSI